MAEAIVYHWPVFISEIYAWYARRHKVALSDYQFGRMVTGPDGQPTDKKVVAGWRRGVQPGHCEGDLILAFHAEYRAMFHSETGENFPTTISQDDTTRA